MPLVFLDSIRREGGDRQSAALNDEIRGPWFGILGHCPRTTLWLDKSIDTSSSRIKTFFYHILALIEYTGRNFSQVFVCNNPISGYLIILGLSLSKPECAIAGVVASIISLLVSMALRQSRDSISCGLSGYNSVLLGVILPNILSIPKYLHWTLIIVSSILSAVLSNSFGQILSSFRPPLPHLTLPFNTLGILISLLTPTIFPTIEYQQQNISVNANETNSINYLLIIQGSLLGAGALFSIQDLVLSILIFVAMIFFSPLLSFAAFCGSLGTTFIGAILGITVRNDAYNGILGFNGLLSACVLTLHYIPTWRSIFLAIASICLTGIIQLIICAYLTQTPFTALSVPFLVSTLLILGVSADGLPRPTILSYPELQRAIWLRDKEEERRNTISMSRDHHMTYSTNSIPLDTVSSVFTGTNNSNETAMYRQTSDIP